MALLVEGDGSVVVMPDAAQAAQEFYDSVDIEVLYSGYQGPWRPEALARGIALVHGGASPRFDAGLVSHEGGVVEQSVRHGRREGEAAQSTAGAEPVLPTHPRAVPRLPRRRSLRCRGVREVGQPHHGRRRRGPAQHRYLLRKGDRILSPRVVADAGADWGGRVGSDYFERVIEPSRRISCG